MIKGLLLSFTICMMGFAGESSDVRLARVATELASQELSKDREDKTGALLLKFARVLFPSSKKLVMLQVL